MKIRIGAGGAGLLNKRTIAGKLLVENAEVDLPDEFAQALIREGRAAPLGVVDRIAEALHGEAPVETAEVAPPEAAIRRSTRPKPRDRR